VQASRLFRSDAATTPRSSRLAPGLGTAAGTITVAGGSPGTAVITVASTASNDKREFPVTVYDPMALDAGEMWIEFTGQFGGRYHDSGSGADMAASSFRLAPGPSRPSER
jgi:hypothetical protein